MLKNILSTHHAILVEGEPEATLAIIKTGLTENGLLVDGNPDIFFLTYQKFGIEDARSVIEMSLGAPVQNEKKIIVFSFDSITNDAQNAFLKIFEDPSPSLKFVLNTYTAEGLLPTLRSRLSIYKNEKELEVTNVDSFMKMPVGEKLKEVEKIVKDYKDGGNKQVIKQFLLGIHYFLEEKIRKSGKGNDLVALKATAKALDYLEDKSSSVKILLESVVLAL
ncbi:MAG: polymerase subunit delta, polymerase subunit delta protein [Candidatus Taylorbacteria bacterium]|nr:polymerase subunit delta, polymerase subunit delta protein [Candidatus Taylorbacteria bacterium]